MLEEYWTTYLERITFRLLPNARDWSLDIFAKGEGLHVVPTLGVNESQLLQDSGVVLLYKWDNPTDMRESLACLVAEWLAPRLGIDPSRADATVVNGIIDHIYADFDSLGLTDDHPWLLGYAPDADAPRSVARDAC